MSERPYVFPQSIDDMPALHLSPAELEQQFNLYNRLKFGSATAILTGIGLIAGSKIGDKLTENNIVEAASAGSGVIGVTLFLTGTLGLIMSDARLQELTGAIKNKGAGIHGIFRKKIEW